MLFLRVILGRELQIGPLSSDAVLLILRNHRLKPAFCQTLAQDEAIKLFPLDYQ